MKPAPLNRDKFTKILALAESDNEGEALAAVRAATRMARAAGLSLGEAVSNGATSDSFDDMATRLRMVVLETENATLRGLVTELRCRLNAKKSRDERFLAGRVEGYEAGLRDAQEAFAAKDAYRDGYRAGYSAGEDSAFSSINTAYGRGYADGKAAAEKKPAQTATKRKRAA